MRSMAMLVVMLGVCGLSACGGGGGGGESGSAQSPSGAVGTSCQRRVADLINGPTLATASSYWECLSQAGETYSVILAQDGSGFSSSIGAFTYSSSGCLTIAAQSSIGEQRVEITSAGTSTTAVAFRQTDVSSGNSVDASCLRVASEASSAAEGEDPQAIADEADGAPAAATPSPNDDEVEESVVAADPALASFIVAPDGTFLGYVNASAADLTSVCNRYGVYGSGYSSTSIWNNYGAYGSTYGSQSAYNRYASTPPILYATDGSSIRALWYVTKNTLKTPRIDPDLLLALLQAYGCTCTR